METQYQISILSKKPLAWPHDKIGTVTDTGHIQTTITTTIPESWIITLDNDDNVIWHEILDTAIETCPHNKPITKSFQCDGCEYLLEVDDYITKIENHKCFNENCMPNNLCQGCKQTNYTETLCNLTTDENGEFDA